MTQRLFDTTTAATYLGIAPKTLRAMIHDGEIAFVQRPPINGKERRLYFLKKEDLDEWIDKNTRKIVA
jgi:excisionase family DNA binding protein